MNKKPFRIALILFISLLPTAIFSSCDKDTNCYLEVTVVDEAKKELGGVPIHLHQNGNGFLDMYGVSDGSGKYTFQVSAEAIVTITAYIVIYDESGEYEMGRRQGDGTARLIPGETVKRTVIISDNVNPYMS